MQYKSDVDMEGVSSENSIPPTPAVVDSQVVKTSDSAENFQTFIYELFEKNGVINDLRAYLRGHIVGVLRSAQTGDPPACQKHFTQRLALPFQALNMLIAEYLLRLEFNYTLSLFVSEIPLANMVFAFAKNLMQVNCGDTGLRFKDEDMWSILNYLGIKCDSDHALNITEMYTKEKDSPLLLCLLKCMPMYTEPTSLDKESSHETLTSSVKSSDTLADNPRPERVPSYQNRCKHYLFCKTCQNNLLKIKEKYKKKKKDFSKNINESSVKPLTVESMLKNVDSMERSLIDEMFQQLKSVYEAEMELIKKEEEQRVKKSLATHALQLQKKWVEMEEKFKARETELVHNVRQKKRFLWGLARLLREQHQHMSRAMQDVRAETSRLSAKEDSLKSQLAEAEQILRQRGEDMRQQISNELTILEAHLESMKKERDSINKARLELEHIKCVCDSTKTTNDETKKEDLCSHYDLLKNEFVILKKYLETAKLDPKCVIERGTITDMAGVTARIDVVLNNGHDVEKVASVDKVKVNQLVNDLKKLKNVNFSQSNVDEIYRDRSRSTLSSDTGEPGGSRGSLQRLKEENERLRTFAQQQREHIDELSSQQARLQAELTAARQPHVAARLPHGAAAVPFRPRTAPTTMPNENYFIQRMSGSVSTNSISNGWRKGAGEELSLFCHGTPRILLPGAPLPFLGVARERRPDNRRYLISQWRTLRRRGSPAGVCKRAISPLTRDANRERANSAGPSARPPPEEDINNNENETHLEDQHYQIARDPYEEQRPKTGGAKNKIREKSPKSVLKEAKDRLRSKDCSKTPPVAREKSPNSVLRDAKLRLRKLEIEAEAVEKSYLDFRRKQEVLREERRNMARSDHVDTAAVKDKDLENNRPSTIVLEARTNESTSYNQPLTLDIGKYVNDYAKISERHFKNKNASAFRVNPIPTAFSTYVTPPIKEKKIQNYLETPLTEFRKYYQSEERVENDRFDNSPTVYTLENRDKSDSISCLRCPTFINTGIFEERKRPRSASTKNREGPKSTINKNRNSSKNDYPSVSIPTSPGTIDVRLLPESQLAKNVEGSDAGNGIEKLRKVDDKVKELEILKENINKLYNLSPNFVAENNESFNEVVDIERKVDNETNDALDIITEVSRNNIASESNSEVLVEDKNLLRIELQSVSQVHDVKITESQTKDLLLVVESSIDSNHVHSDVDNKNDIGSTQMTILVTPKRSNDKNSVEDTQTLAKSRNSDSGENAVKISGHDILNSIYEAAPNDNISSVQMQLDLSKDALEHASSELEGNEPDYPDDFSADVDNFNSTRENTNQSPISMPKTSEDENFWDS